MKPITMTVTALLVFSGCVYGLSLINEATKQTESVTLTLDSIYSRLDKDSEHLKLTSSNLNDITQMGGFLAINDRNIALGGVCQVPLSDASKFLGIHLTLTEVKVPSQNGNSLENREFEISYETELVIKGDSPALRLAAATFSRNVSKSLQNGFNALRACHIKKANSASINEL